MHPVLLCLLLGVMPTLGQGTIPKTDQPSSHPTNSAEFVRMVEMTRSNCIQGRRIICGKIVKVLPGGLVVESGYTNLMRLPLESSWLIPKTVEAKRESNLVEKAEPDSVCIGLVYLTDYPKLRRAKPQLYDFVILEGFPAGNFTYNSVGTIQHTVRHFSASLAVAVRTNLKDAGHHDDSQK